MNCILRTYFLQVPLGNALQAGSCQDCTVCAVSLGCHSPLSVQICEILPKHFLRKKNVLHAWGDAEIGVAVTQPVERVREETKIDILEN